MTRSARAAALRSTALATGLALSVGLSAVSVEAWAKPKVPLPKPRPIARNVVPKTTPASPTTANPTSAIPTQHSAAQTTAPASPGPAPILAPATRQHAALPAARKHVTPAAVAATSSTSQSDKDALENVIELVRKRKPGDATQAQAAISDPVARKLAEWLILRSDDNGASVERYRAFISANPSWPSQTFLRRRIEAALWDDRRDDATVWSWFENESPISAKGKFALARVMIGRGDRANAERLVRDAWRHDGMTEDTENTALDLFGALLTAGDHKARMDFLLYGTEQEAGGLRAAKRLGAGHMALAKARIAATRKGSNLRALLDAVPRELHGDPGYTFARIQLLRREEKFAEAAQLMMGAPKDPGRLHNLNEWWVERRLLARKMMDVGEHRNAYLIARDAALPSRDIYKTEQEFTAGWIALRFLKDPAVAAQHFARIGVGSVNPTALARAGYWQGRAAEAAGRAQEARAAYTRAAEQSTSYYGQLARAKLGLPQIDLNGVPRGRGAERLEIVRAVQLLYELQERELAIPIFGDMGENGDPDALAGLGELTARYTDARGMLLLGKAALNRGLPFDHYAYPVNGIPPFKSIGPEVEQSIVYAICRQESAFNQAVVSPAQAYGLMQVTPDAGRYVAKRAGVSFDLNRMKTDPVYNAAMGAAELGGLLEDYRGSYILTFAAYNAGRGSVKKWIERYGDPRDPKVDAVDWVEQIPFSETRNYVQRIMENLQVYRARFGGGTRLQIEADLRRGSSVE
ncbi:transglycosylase SLT domain-containing protein [Bradyrhizobium sp. AUGA SZCCT0240]|uniref:lytic transglycosylase domain-containing protein n=1 Tax=unclassified Bradyrhizobium TaxID=2631580 RepID=UPI001BACF1DC|nr:MULTISPECIES: lytic transglycosylase domain-containing protein [unclassified Bradyrhizobium]MBR1199340.1 transglycosylase SLT domain-containing protein [Bradyrhizobium sp. AUGA SZCCT0158]MBR1241120.1 transglycosylase SLT domain-containing protein [Bradyrhizobium sp. AUGA SZCCT0274]MBR1246766.1 transglycosylase SLT domain-containing protein [Bradyrhizobium sp. AUGA SZCCT0169]MBR1255822.1 transglycosylase SLT domain-containing protein [Bradyrhizobium sp. AUGA SZCCT0240]